MKKLGVLLIVLLCFSCTSTSYIFQNPAQTSGLNFAQGKWLLNGVDVPASLTEKITNLAMQDFSKNLNERLSYAPTTKGILLSQKKISIDPSKLTLQNIYKGTNYDYFINIKATVLKNDFNSVDLTNHNFRSDNNTKSSEVIIEIYDLKNADIIYSQKIIASANQSARNEDITITKAQNAMIVAAYKKLIKDINKRSMH